MDFFFKLDSISNFLELLLYSFKSKYKDDDEC